MRGGSVLRVGRGVRRALLRPGVCSAGPGAALRREARERIDAAMRVGTARARSRDNLASVSRADLGGSTF